ncbi:MAG: hypothetical protein Tsb009_09540 [Planctomycetaceae bacterium]
MIAIPQDPTELSPSTPVHPLLRAWRVVLRHRKKAGLFFIVTVVLVVVGVLVCPKTYQSEAKLFVRMGRESVTLDPTATTGQVVAVHESRENEINSVMEVIQSRVILERVVDALGPDRILYGKATQNGEQTSAQKQEAVSHQQASGMSAGMVFDKSPKREKAIRTLEKAFRVTHAKKSSVIGITCKASSPELAQQIVQEALKAFHDLHLKVNRTAGSKKFFTKQTELLQGQLDKATLALRKAKNELGVVTMTGRQNSLQEQIRENQTAISSNQADLASTQATIASLETLLKTVPRELQTQRIVGFPNGAADRARQRVNELKIRERELLTRFTERHPDVIALRKQLAEAEKILEKEAPRGAQLTTASNPANQQLMVRLLTQKAQLASLQARAKSLEAHRKQLYAQLEKLNAEEGRIARLTQDVELLRASHRSYSERLEQARIDAALGEQRISNVNVVQPPTYITKPVSPKKRIVVLLGAFVAAVGAVGVAFLAEYRSRQNPNPQLEEVQSSPTTESTVLQDTAVR